MMIAAWQKYTIGRNEQDNVLIDWGSSFRFIVLTPEQALTLAGWLVEHAKSQKILRSRANGNAD